MKEVVALKDGEEGRTVLSIFINFFLINFYQFYFVNLKNLRPFPPCLGGCRNSSPAGKRRVPSRDSSISEGYEVIDKNPDNNDSASLAVTAATTIAVAICLASVALFATIFVALQVRM